jgi:hypothetical protein
MVAVNMIPSAEARIVPAVPASGVGAGVWVTRGVRSAGVSSGEVSGCCSQKQVRSCGAILTWPHRAEDRVAGGQQSAGSDTGLEVCLASGTGRAGRAEVGDGENDKSVSRDKTGARWARGGSVMYWAQPVPGSCHRSCQDPERSRAQLAQRSGTQLDASQLAVE